MENPTSQQGKVRAALYVDGFNLYHPIHRMGPQNNHLKWACLWQLGENLAQPHGQELVKVVFCTAVPKVHRDAGKHDRHVRFNKAQRAKGVEVLEGHYVPEPIEENGIPTDRKKWTEKQTDINVALSLIMDGLDDKYDVAFLLSADTDQVATARVFSARLAPLGKTLIGVAPPDRDCPAGYSAHGIKSVKLRAYDIERCILPEAIQTAETLIVRPKEYDPPTGWVHPKDRPSQKPSKPPRKWGPAIKF